MTTGALASDDETLVRAARRIVRQFNISAGEQAMPMRLPQVPLPPASDPASMRLIVDDLVAQVSHLQNLFAVRESTHEAVVERLDRLVVTLEGRVDALTADLDEFRRGHALAQASAVDEIDQARSSIAAELTPILDMCRAMVFETETARDVVAAEIREAGVALSYQPDKPSKPTS